MNITADRKTALFLSIMALFSGLWSLYMVLKFAYSPLLILFVLSPLAAVIGIISGNKVVLVTSSLALIVSAFIYLKDSEKVQVDENRKQIALNAAYGSLIFAIASVSFEGQWLPAKIALWKWILPDIEIIYLFLLFVALPIHGSIIA